jgi:hypothetical protein
MNINSISFDVSLEAASRVWYRYATLTALRNCAGNDRPLVIFAHPILSKRKRIEGHRWQTEVYRRCLCIVVLVC